MLRRPPNPIGVLSTADMQRHERILNVIDDSSVIELPNVIYAVQRRDPPHERG